MILKYYHTLIHLKPIQIRYQFWYRIRRYWRKLIRFKYPLSIEREAYPVNLNLKPFIPKYTCFNNYEFNFLNQTQTFTETELDWDFKKFGKLWTYNLNYFDFLLQPGMNPDIGKSLIEDFVSKFNNNSTALEPYPIAIRSINWIKFLTVIASEAKQPLPILQFSNSLFAQYQILLNNLECHLLGNHLLEDGFSLLFGAYYFKDEKLYKEAKKILIPQLNEQILLDGAHFELSPMYHCILLFRMLDCYNLVSNNSVFDHELGSVFKEKIELMLSWINLMTFRNGNIPLINDAAFKIAPTPIELNDYALRLGLDVNKQLELKESGYRKFSTTKFELVADIGAIGPDYQPGHAHADTFSFELHINDRPVIVDTGTSTYEVNEARFYERSTLAHNTVVVNNMNSSQVWGGHRVAKRAKVQLIKDLPDLISASHNGYQSLGQTHTRTFLNLDNDIRIIDEITQQGVYYLHFHPDEEFKVCDQTIVGKDYSISFSGADSIECFDSEYSPEFNKRIPSKSIRITFRNRLETHFK